VDIVFLYGSNYESTGIFSVGGGGFFSFWSVHLAYLFPGSTDLQEPFTTNVCSSLLFAV
jgi:hypothetical protein